MFRKVTRYKLNIKKKNVFLYTSNGQLEIKVLKSNLQWHQKKEKTQV